MAEARVTISVTSHAKPWHFTKLFRDSIYAEPLNAAVLPVLLVTLSFTTNSRTNTGIYIYASLWNHAFLFFLTLCFHLTLIHLYPASKSHPPEPLSLPGVKIQTTSASLIVPKPCLSITGESASQVGPLQNPGRDLLVIFLSNQIPISGHLLQLWKELQPWTGIKTFIDISRIQGLEVPKFAFQPYYPYFHLCILPLMTSSGKTL